MLINLRNALMAGKRLPYDAEVEFLESTGTQYVDTGIDGDSDTVAELSFAMTDSARSDAGIFGSRKGYRQDCFVVLRVAASNGAFWMHYGNEGTSANYISTVIGNTTAWHTARLARSWSIDTSTGTAGQYTFTTPTTLKVFAADTSASGRWYAKMRLASLKIYSNNLLVFDGIPVRKGTTGELYDRVSGKFAERHGDLVLGQDVVPVEYIESHGAEYIDTGVKGSQNLRTTFDYQLIYSGTAPLQQGLFGCFTAGMKYHLYCSGTAPSAFQVGMGNSYIDTIPVDNVRHSIEFNNRAVSVDENVVATFEPYGYPTGRTLLLFALHNASGGLYSMMSMRKWRVQMWDDGTPVRNFQPVRVGTDTTSWEGAMMDVLTRRIYRNAGTGAFGYGNDLPYPIPAS